MSTKKRGTKRERRRDFLRTESGNAEMFAAAYGMDVRWDDKQARWLVWNGQRWVGDADKAIRYKMKKAIRLRFGEALKMAADEPDRVAESKWCLKSESRYAIDAALELAKSEPPIFDNGEGWDADPWLLGVANGVLDLRTRKLRRETQQDRITKFSPVAFDADAKCPRWHRFLDEVFGSDKSLIRFIQKAAGYSMSGRVVEHIVIVLYGTGRNGKTTLLEVLFYILGDYAADLRFAVLESDRKMALGEGVSLPGARFVKSVETKRGRHLDEGRIKAWSGGDTITVRPLHRNDFTFPPTHKLWLAVNDKPEIDDSSPAMWERIRLVPFERRFVGRERDKDLLEKLKAEAAGILNWMLEGLRLWQKEGLEPPEAVAGATGEYEEESDLLSPFVKEACEIGEDFEVGRGELYDAYQEYCEKGGQEALKVSDFKSRMAQKFTPGRSGHGGKKVWKGLRLQPVAGDGVGCPMVSEIPGNSPIETSIRKDTEKPDTARHPDTAYPRRSLAEAGAVDIDWNAPEMSEELAAMGTSR